MSVDLGTEKLRMPYWSPGSSKTLPALNNRSYGRSYSYKVMRKATPLTRELRIIWRVAEYILSFHGQDQSEETLRQFVFEICSLTPTCNVQMVDGRLWLEGPSDDEAESGRLVIHDDDEDFLENLLAVAVAMNDITLVKQLLSVVKDRPYLIFQEGSCEHR